MRIYAVIVIFGLSLLLTGCPGKPEKAEHETSMADPAVSTTTTEMALPEQHEGMENMEGEKKMEESSEQSDTK